MIWSAIKRRWKPVLVAKLLSYDGDALIGRLRRLGLSSGDTLMVHATWRAHNGFAGAPLDFVNALRRAVGPDGLLCMPSMPYHQQSSAEYLDRNEPLDIRRTPSRMGILSEVFRRQPDVLRSLSPTHPLLAWGRDAESFLAGHEKAVVPFGPASPFGRLVERDAAILLVDTAFSSVTFTHFLEDRIAGWVPFPLYENRLRHGTVIDAEGVARTVPVRVLSAEANRARREHRLVARLRREGIWKERRIGNTRMSLLRCRAMVGCIDAMAAEGDTLFDPPERPMSLPPAPGHAHA